MLSHIVKASLTVLVVGEGSSVMRGIRARHASPRIPLVRLRNQEREHIHINPSKLYHDLQSDWRLTEMPRRRTATLEDRMHQLETLIQAIPPAVFAAGGALPGSSSGPQLAPDSATSPLASFASSTHTFPSGVPPPSLHVFPLMNPSTHFTSRPRSGSRAQSPGNSNYPSILSQYPGPSSPTDDLTERTSRMALSASYLYIDDEGYTRWQGETSGLPLLDLLMEDHGAEAKRDPGPDTTESSSYAADHGGKTPTADWFPHRTPRRPDINPQAMWRLITSHIPPDLMDRLVLTTFILPSNTY